MIAINGLAINFSLGTLVTRFPANVLINRHPFFLAPFFFGHFFGQEVRIKLGKIVRRPPPPKYFDISGFMDFQYIVLL